MRPSLGSILTRPVALIFATALLALGVTAAASGSARGPAAKASKRVVFIESGRMKLIGEKGRSLTERGKAAGTYNATMLSTFTIRSKSVNATVTIYPSGGSITGVANANYRVVKNLGYFEGTFTLGRGTGKFSHASEVNGKSLAFSGVINRDTLEVEVKAKGEANL
ncbi:MAG: hypothetical protein ACRDK2_07150 [Solirubrobacteraceae bacterium]